MKIQYCTRTAYDCNETRHPEDVMEELGIKYTNSIPKPAFDCWTFEGCEGMPEELPGYLSYYKIQ